MSDLHDLPVVALRNRDPTSNLIATLFLQGVPSQEVVPIRMVFFNIEWLIPNEALVVRASTSHFVGIRRFLCRIPFIRDDVADNESFLDIFDTFWKLIAESSKEEQVDESPSSHWEIMA